MPEGPTIVMLKEAVQPFEGRKIKATAGNSKIDMESLLHQPVHFKSWGKHFLICMPQQTLRVHFLMFGSYSINEHTRPDRSLRLALTFDTGSLYLYTCAIKVLEDEPDVIYDWSADVMNGNWSAAKAKKKLKAMQGTMVCDALLDQQVFSGVGNIIKNEVQYRTKIHPESMVAKLPVKQLNLLVKEAQQYAFDFLAWKKVNELKKHWLCHTKKTCLRCNLAFEKKYCGKTKRRTFFCTNCQVLYE